MSGFTKPPSIMGDSFAGCIDILRIQATDDKMSGKKDDFKRRKRDARPLHRTISNWYFSI